MFQVKFNAKWLRAAWLFVGKAGATSNPAYAHVIVDRTLVATDGRAMLVVNPAEVGISGNGAAPFLLPRWTLEALGDLQGEVTFYIDLANGKGLADTGHTFDLPRDKIVNWRRAYPQRTTGEHAQYNLAYLDRCVRANELLGEDDYCAGASLEIQPNGQDGPGIVVLREGSAHVIVNYMYTRNHSQPFNRFNL